MKTGHKPNVKKLSKAMRVGKQIADETGIKQGKRDWIKLNKDGTQIDCACALGMALIGKHGVDKTIQIAKKSEADWRAPSPGSQVEKDFPVAEKVNKCLLNTEVVKRKRSINSFYDVQSVVMTLNDKNNLPVETIAEALESCNL